MVVPWQVYYDLREERKSQGKEKEVALVRVEQLAPFPFDLINRELKRYPNASVMWCVTGSCSLRALRPLPHVRACCRAVHDVSLWHSGCCR